jgi:hypothetical protein
MTHSNEIIIGDKGQVRDSYIHEKLKELFGKSFKICSIATSLEFCPTYNGVVSRHTGFNSANITEEEIAREIDSAFDLFFTMDFSEPHGYPLALVIEDTSRLMETIKSDFRLLRRFEKLIELATKGEISIWMVARSYPFLEDNIDKSFIKTLNRTILLNIKGSNKANQANWSELCSFLKISKKDYTSSLELAKESIVNSAVDTCIYSSKSRMWKSISATI